MNGEHKVNDTCANPKIPAALAQFDFLPDSAYVDIRTLAALDGVSIATAWRRIKSRQLPSGEKLGPNTTRFNVGKIRVARANRVGA